MNKLYILLLLGCFTPAFGQSGAITSTELEAHQYALTVDTTGISELSLSDQRVARAATAGVRKYTFKSGGFGTIYSKGGLADGNFLSLGPYKTIHCTLQ